MVDSIATAVIACSTAVMDTVKTVAIGIDSSTVKEVIMGFVKGLDWSAIGKWISLVLGSGIGLPAIWNLLGILFPNSFIYSINKKFSIFVTRLLRQKWTEKRVDSFDTSYYFALKGQMDGLLECNSDIKTDTPK